jgi:putative ABC transport system permease protein
MQTLLHDLKYAIRGLRRHWAFSLVVVLTLSMGIGANTIVYSLVDGIVLNPFPYPDPDRLVGLGSEWPRLNRELGFFETLSPQEYLDVKTQTETMEDVVMWDLGYRSVSHGGDRPEVVFTAFWFDDAFPTLGMPPALGRGFSGEELERGDRVAVVSHRHWVTRLGGASDAVGKTLYVEGDPYTIIGVMPKGALIYGTDLWIPIGAAPSRFPRGRRNMQILARIKPAHTLADVNTELAAISGRIEREYGGEFEEYAGWRIRALTWTEVNVRAVKPMAFALLGAVGFVLLIVCANVASLLLARSAGRRKEVAVRTALGADRVRIVRQFLTESLVLAGIGGIAGIAFTRVAVPALLSSLPRGVPVPAEFELNLRVMLFTAVISAIAGVVFGLAPAIQTSRSHVQGALKADGGRSTSGVARQRLQRLFVGAEFAVALILLSVGGLFAHSFIRMQHIDPGFETSNVLTMRLTLPRGKYRGEQITTFFQQLADRVEGLPGVREAGAGTQFPPITFSRGQIAIEGQAYSSDDELPTAYLTLVTDGYHEALGIPLVSGRTFSQQDTRTTPGVAVINEAAARQFFPNGSTIGKRFKIGSASAEGPWVEIVGVVRSVRNLGPEADPAPEIYGNIRQFLGAWNQLYLVVRTERDPHSFLEAVQREVAALDPDQPVYAVQTVEEAFADLGAARRLGTLVLSIFALFALALAAAGIYAVVSFGVAERTKEIGVRIALGARGRSVRRLVVQQAMTPIAIGGVVGFVTAIAMGRAVSSLLFEISGTDPVTLLSVSTILIGVALTASYLPARRASRLDPTVALRDE